MFSNTKQNFSVQVFISLFICMLLLSACDKKDAEIIPKVDTSEKNEKPVETTSSSTATVSKTKFDQMLDDYEAIIVEYETIAKKEVICSADWMNLMSEVNPKLVNYLKSLPSEPGYPNLSGTAFFEILYNGHKYGVQFYILYDEDVVVFEI
jgi:hypothetical protein